MHKTRNLNIFTYEADDTHQKLETYEWDNVWLEHAPDNQMPRAMLIGDSISCGYRHLVTELADGKWYADGIGTSKALDNDYFPKLIDYVLAQENGREVIQFNNGLHGWHLSDGEYRKYYTVMVDFLLTKTNRLILALTTPTRDTADLRRLGERNERVLARNEIVCEIAAEKRLAVNDFYTLTVDQPDLWLADGIHFKEEGYRLLAAQTVEMVAKFI